MTVGVGNDVGLPEGGRTEIAANLDRPLRHELAADAGPRHIQHGAEFHLRFFALRAVSGHLPPAIQVYRIFHWL